MNHPIKAIFASAAALAFSAGAAFAQDQAAPASAEPAPVVLTPAVTPPLSQNPSPMTYDLGPLGNKVYVTGVLSGLGFTQSNRTAADNATWGDLSNAQVMINKTDGMFQYFVQVGAYSIPSLGYAYVKASTQTANSWDLLPQAFIKIQPTANFSVQAGKLPTLIGAEYTFTFQNSNIERGLLWGQENAVTRGVQANYSTGPLAFSLSWNDGFYSNKYNSITGAATWTINPANILIFSGGGNFATSKAVGFATPLYQNNQQIFNLIYTHTEGQWSITPYFQYTRVPKITSIGADKASSTYGGAVLATYTFPSDSSLAGFSIPVRGEYITSTGTDTDGSVNLLYGQGSNAWSLTVTPTYTYKRWFIRGEVSYVKADKIGAGLGFGTDGSKRDQTRGLVEVGLMF